MAMGVSTPSSGGATEKPSYGGKGGSGKTGSTHKQAQSKLPKSLKKGASKGK